jgi:hypothetical protein
MKPLNQNRMKEKTAVEWFFKCLFEKHGEFTLEQIKTDNPKLWEVYQQAKEMEKENTIDFAETCLQNNSCFFDIEEHYNKTFKSE